MHSLFQFVLIELQHCDKSNSQLYSPNCTLLSVSPCNDLHNISSYGGDIGFLIHEPIIQLLT